MNYRHTYHAGNFADCFKHALLITLLDAIARKSTPYFVLDTHAGAGQYDLAAKEARLTAEADSGIQRLLLKPAPSLKRYLGLVEQLGLYPGSPLLIRAVMRAHDRLACCELHPEDAATLRRHFKHDPLVEVHARSGWEALGGLLPPKEKRGLVFIDPPFEAPGEFFTLADGLRRGYDRFSHGVFAAWYPIKQRAAVRGFHTNLTLSGIRDIVAIELCLEEMADPDRLTGCGLIVINPPYQFEDQAYLVANVLLDGLTANEIGARTSLVRLSNE